MMDPTTLYSRFAIITICMAWAGLAARVGMREGFFELAHSERKVPNDWIPFRDVLGAFAFFLLAQVVLGPALGCLWVAIQTGYWTPRSPEAFTKIQGWINTGSIFLSAGALGLFCTVIEPRSFAVSRGYAASTSRVIIGKDIAKGALGWFIAYPVVMIVNQTVSIVLTLLGVSSEGEQAAVHYVKSTLSEPLLFCLTTTAVIFIVPVLEEILFRGFFQTWVKQHRGRVYAILITSALFAFFHFSFSQGIKNIELLTSLFALSCFLGFVFERYRSIWVSIGLHGTFNAISIVMIFLQESVAA